MAGIGSKGLEKVSWRCHLSLGFCEEVARFEWTMAGKLFKAGQCWTD
jgi:hypothetical protein